MWWGTGDNYAYLLSDDATKDSWIIDPSEPKVVLPQLSKANLKAIVNTHHHMDHSGGNAELKMRYPSLPVIAGHNSPLVDKTPADRSKLKLGSNIEITAIHTPCHTQDSICYYAEDSKTGQRAVFTGDTLFNAGCGRFFEGNAEEMWEALGSLAKLPKDTSVWTGHEYTKANAKFAQTVLHSDVDKLLKYCNSHEKTAGVFTIGDELVHNPFMRVNEKKLQQELGVDNAVDAMQKLRELKNKF